MLISRLSEYTIRLILSSDDAKRLNVTEALKSREETARLLPKFIKKAESSLNIKLSGGELYIEFFKNGGGYIIYLSCKKAVFRPSDEICVIRLSLSELEGICGKLSSAGGVLSSLYYADRKYFLILSLEKADGELMRAVAEQGCVFGFAAAAAVREHCRLLCRGNALGKISAISRIGKSEN